jgi:hypothetical protein
METEEISETRRIAQEDFSTLMNVSCKGLVNHSILHIREDFFSNAVDSEYIIIITAKMPKETKLELNSKPHIFADVSPVT